MGRLPEAKRNATRNLGLGLALLFRVLMVFGGLKLVELTEPPFRTGRTGSPIQYATSPSWRAASF